MRVIAGSARRTQLKTLEGMDTRPTTDRIKETLFNMIAPYLYDSIFLDLFAGSGGIGIEALSRGAMEAVFVEKNPKAMACVKENLQKTHFERKGMTMQMDVMTALYKLEGEKQFDYIFMDPPYNHELEKSVLTYLAESSLLAEEGIIIVETLIMQKILDITLSKKKNIRQISMYFWNLREGKKYVNRNLSGKL